MRNTTLYKNKPKTFRRSSTKLLPEKNKKNVGWGTNLQNIEKSMREIYQPDGFVPEVKAKCKYWLETGDLSIFTEQELECIRCFAQTDQSGAEALIVAYDSPAGDYRKLFENKIKPHVYVAMKLFQSVWRKKMKEHGGLIEDFNMEEISNTPIPLLRQNPFWLELDKLIKSSDDWPITERYYYLAKQTCHCVDKTTQILTRKGWQTVENYKGGEIAVFDGSSIKFEVPSKWNVFEFKGNLLHFTGDEVDQAVTPGHKIVNYSNNKLSLLSADYAKSLSSLRFPTSAFYSGGSVNLPSWKIKLLVAIQADGYWYTDGTVRFRFVKQHKIDRLKKILSEGNISYEFHYGGLTDTLSSISECTVKGLENVCGFFEGKKEWGAWLLNFSLENLKTLVEELSWWDGTYTKTYLHKREEYITAISNNARWIKTIAHLVGKQGTINYKDSVYKIGLNNRKFSRVKYSGQFYYEDKVYCPTVSTGMFLTRRNLKISITGNSANYGIEKNTFRMNILEKSGGKIVIPVEEADRFLNTYRSLFPEIPEGNRMIEKQVLETRVLYNMFGFPYQITDLHIENKMKEYYAWPRQSTVGEITRIAYTRMQEYIENERKKWDLLADTHDSYLTQFPLMDVKDIIQKQQEFINQRLVSPVDGTIFYMKSETNIGFNWSPKKEGKNDLGLREVKWLNN